MARGRRICPAGQTLFVKLSVGPHPQRKALQLPVHTKDAEAAWDDGLWKQNTKHTQHHPTVHWDILRSWERTILARFLFVEADVLEVHKDIILHGFLERSLWEADARIPCENQGLASGWNGFNMRQVVPPEVQRHQRRCSVSPIKLTSEARTPGLNTS